MVFDHCSAVILAGGLSRRMGQDKALLAWGADNLLNNSIIQLTSLFSEVVVSVRSFRPNIAVRQVVDGTQDCGPMSGLLTAMSEVDADWFWVQAVDMPFISKELICSLAEKRAGYQAVIPNIAGQVQPLAGFYERSCLPVFQQQLQQQQYSVKRALASLQVNYISEQQLNIGAAVGDDFFDLDTPDDVYQAKQRIKDSE